MKKKVLFIDRDGTLIAEPPVTFQVDTLEQLAFLPGVIRNLCFICRNLDFELVIVTNQDGLGTPSYPQENFDRVQRKMLEVFAGEGVYFDDILVDTSFPEDNSPDRKPRTGMLGAYMAGDYDIENSYVIGDRETDMELAKNLGCKGIRIFAENNCNAYIPYRKENATKEEHGDQKVHEAGFYTFDSWDKIKDFLFAGERQATVQRKTKETDICVNLNLDGNGACDISTGIGFFDHMLEQIGKHGGLDLTVKVDGDLHVDEHHTIEDTAIAVGEALLKALGNKRGIERYGYCLPMDDCLCSVALDFGGRPWLVWDVTFKREKIGEMPTDMFLHFFKSLSDAAKMNLNIKAEGENEHHKAEGIFKALAKAIKMAVERNVYKYELPSTKGVL
ncbi:MAG: bifunctional histidinol-phosphatase/imidazoleglycerol-phosphate dehydratase HisB [Tannerella sp.]|jgi:imidazoleglycerol-phosphate dehydratase/histidinol-phosphatase|nr:bifunctional histidinol-phosphatase/imidazoleglycerol-phosphate dehydratase HisB [Tannerella sp.]